MPRAGRTLESRRLENEDSEAYKRGRIKKQHKYYNFGFWRDEAALLIRPSLIRPGLRSPKGHPSLLGGVQRGV